MSCDELMKKIDSLDFARHEAQLFLDTHPDCKAALDYFNRTTDMLEELRTKYQDSYGPLVATASGTESYRWVDGPWPWQLTDAEKAEKKGGKG